MSLMKMMNLRFKKERKKSIFIYVCIKNIIIIKQKKKKKNKKKI